jgi:site-specific DNA-cytosine methylase
MMRKNNRLITMKKTVFLMMALVAMTSFANKTKSNASDADSTVVTEMSDTLNNVEAVERQVNAVYAYWNDLRQYGDEDRPCVDELFGSKEWWRVRKEVVEIDRACECGGFFDFGEEGPLDPWTYDCYEGYVSANDIKVKLQPDGTAEVNFLVKDAATGELRILTPVECERLNMFPDNWTDSGMPENRRYFMMGNALVTGIISRLGERIADIIDNE